MRSLLRKARGDQLARQRAPKAVAAQHQGVVVAQRRRLGQLDLGTGGGADAIEDLVRSGWAWTASRARGLVDQHLNARVIRVCALDPALANVGRARVAGVRPYAVAFCTTQATQVVRGDSSRPRALA